MFVCRDLWGRGATEKSKQDVPLTLHCTGKHCTIRLNSISDTQYYSYGCCVSRCGESRHSGERRGHIVTRAGNGKLDTV